MFTWLRRIIEYPADIQLTQTGRVARQLYLLSLILLQSTIIVLVAVLIFHPVIYPDLLASLTAIVVLIATMVLLRLRQIQAACLMLVFGLWVSMALTALFNNGVQSIAYHSGLMIVTLSASILLGSRAAFISALGSIIFGFGMAFGTSQGWFMPQGNPLVPVVQWIIYSVLLIAAVALLQLATSSIAQALREAEQQLQERREVEQKLALTLEAARMVTWNWDVEQSQLRWTGPLAALTGLHPEEVSTTFDELINRFHPDDQRAMRDRLTSVRVAMQPEYYVEARIVREPQGVRWFELVGRAHSSPAGHFTHMDGALIDITQRKQIELALRLSESRLRSLLLALPDLVLIHGADTRYLEIYTGEPGLLAAPIETVLGRTPAAIFGDPHGSHMEDIIRRAIQTGETQTYEYSIELDGASRWFQARLAPFEHDGEPRVICLTRDTSRQKQVEQQIREREELYRRSVTAANAVPYYRDLINDRYTFIGSGITDMIGYTPEEITTTLFDSLDVSMIMYGQLDHMTIDQAIAAARSGQATEWKVDMLLRTRNGELRWIADSAAMAFDERGRVIGSYGILQDITARKKTDQALAESQERFKMLAEAGFEGIGVISDGSIRDANQRLSEMTGYGRDELLGLPVERLFATQERSAARRQLASDANVSLTLIALRKQGTTFPVDIHVRHIPDGQVIAIRDMSERQQMEEQLRRAQKIQAVGQLAGGLAHDFNNLLTVINSYAMLIAERAHSDGLPEWINEDLEQLHHAGDRAAALTRQLLALSRQQVLKPQVIDLNEVVYRMAPLVERLLGTQTHLQLRLHPTILHVRADTGQLEQVLLNLVVNARDAMPEGGVLVIRTRFLGEAQSRRIRSAELKPGEYAVISVQDTGHGMTPDVQARIFEPYFTTKPEDRGTGLGLATAHGIITQSGGQLWFNSQSGVGTTFYIGLPYLPSQPYNEPAELQPQAAYPTILLVEDDHAILRLARMVLERHHYTVLAVGPHDALSTWELHKQQITMLVTDIVMPKLSGIELARTIRNQRPDLPVLFISGYSDQRVLINDDPRCLSVFLQKPFTPDMLAEHVNRILRTNQLAESPTA